MSRTLELTQDLISRNSVTPVDAGCQDVMARRLAAIGFEIEPLRYGNVENLWAVRGHSGPVLCLAGHTDVVPTGPLEEWRTDPFVPTIRDGERLITDSFAIALYLDEAYPASPSLFGGEGGRAMARFVERWTNLTVHAYVGQAVLMDIHGCLDAEDQVYFRQSRETRYGRRLEDVPVARDERLAAFRASLEPLRATLAVQPWLGGDDPLFCDYIVAGAFQWARVVSPYPLLENADPVAEWFARCLGLYGGLGRQAAAAA